MSSGAIVSAAYTIDEDESFAKYAFLDHFSARALINNIVYSGFNGVSAPAVGSEMCIRDSFYTARKELSAGFQLISRRFAVTPQVDVSWSTFITVSYTHLTLPTTERV